jgi:pimeloyl-ACP methyl ester carboxylesterase/DNA-binding CsgD family transcriptional regulator
VWAVRKQTVRSGCKRVHCRNAGYRMAARKAGHVEEPPAVEGNLWVEQSVGWVDLPDGTSVAYATAGVGPPLLFVGGWLSHLELSWDLRAERAFLETLASGRTLVRYDRSGCGMSDRPNEGGWSLDLEEVTIRAVMSAVGGTKFDLIGSSLGVPIAIDWAARHPETINRLVLYGGWARGKQVAAPQVRDHVVGLIRSAWGLGSDVLTEMFAPEASAETRAALSNYQRQSSSAETAADLLLACYDVDVFDRLGDVTSPTLLLHRRYDRAAPLEQSQLIASRIEGARLVELPGRSHLPYVGDVDALVREIRRFLELPSLRKTAVPTLTKRQKEVADLVSQGMTNREIAQRLCIDERTAEGHVERIRDRLGFRSRAQIAAWWVASRASH